MTQLVRDIVIYSLGVVTSQQNVSSQPIKRGEETQQEYDNKVLDNETTNHLDRQGRQHRMTQNDNIYLFVYLSIYLSCANASFPEYLMY